MGPRTDPWAGGPLREVGVKAAPSDAHVMARLEGAGFLETVLSGRDLQEDYRATRAAFKDHDVLVVHAPFTVPNGAEVDVADPDAKHREASLEMWRASCRLAREVDARWVVLHPGGIVPKAVSKGPEGVKMRADALDRTTNALCALEEDNGADLVLVENMPAHYHRASGETHAALTGQGLMDFLGWRDHVAGICLDTSHAVLTPGGVTTLETFLRRTGGEIKHVHLGDAVPPEKEGLALGAGVIPWDRVRSLLNERAASEVSAVPEVHRGHEDGGAGFVEALRFARLHL